MKALCLTGPLTLELRELPPPPISSGESIIDVEITGLGGSEYLGFRNPGIRKLPSVMGHGFAGTTQEGRRVAVNPLTSCGACEFCQKNRRQLCPDWSLIGVHRPGGFGQQVSVPISSLVQLPDVISWEQAVFIEPFANSVHAWELSGATIADEVGVLGAGSLGLGLATMASERGANKVFVCDYSKPRQDAAKQVGATAAGALLEETYDVVFDTVGTAQSRHMAIEHVRPGGTVVLLGFAEVDPGYNAVDFIRCEKRIIGSFIYTAEQFRQAVALAGKTDGRWVKNLAFRDVESVLNTYLARDFSIIKAALRPGFE